MYLRTTGRKNSEGSVVKYSQLAHNVRHADTGNSVAEIIHNLGRADQLDRDDPVRLCRSVARVCGVEVHDPLDGAAASPSHEPTPFLSEGVTLVRTLDFGVPLVVEALRERLKLGPTLLKAMEDSGGATIQERALLAMSANRLCEPLRNQLQTRGIGPVAAFGLYAFMQRR